MKDKSAKERTVVVNEAKLLPGLRSSSKAVTATGFVTIPKSNGVATRVTVALVLFVSMPKPQTMNPPKLVHPPWVLVAETKATFVGNKLVNSTCDAG